MIQIQPFCALRPEKDQAQAVASLPYDVFSEAEARQVVLENSASFLQVVRPETTLSQGIDLYDPAVYAQGKANLERLVADGILVQDDCPGFYLYQLVRNGRAQTGIVACASVQDYLDGRIKRHELTREDKENDRVRHIQACGANTGPVFLTYKGREDIDAVVEAIQKTEPVADFCAEDGIIHRVWVIQAAEIIQTIIEAFQTIDCLYIADGHHRAAAAARVAQTHWAEGDSQGADMPWNGFLSVIFPAEQLTVLDYNRVVADLNGLDKDGFLKAVSQSFEIGLPQTAPIRPQAKGTFALYLDDQWFVLKVKDTVTEGKDPVAALDVSILQDHLLAPILGIQDPRTDPRIDFVGGIRGLEELERRVHEDMTVAFALYPTSVKELMAIADAGRLMPPKSTWFEPKLRSGLFVHKIEAVR